MNRRALITGANGFIGVQLHRELLLRDFFILSVVRQSTEKSADILNMDLASNNFSAAVCEGIEIVFHLAAKAHALAENHQDEDEYFQINTEGTRKLLEAAKQAGVQTFIYFSSVKAVGDIHQQPMDESVNAPADTAYGRSKYAAEQLVLQGGYVPHPVVIRPCMVYGNTDKGNLPQMILAIAKGIFPPLPEVNNRRSMVHVDDVVAAAILAARNPKAAGQVYIVTDGQTYSTRQIYDWIRLALAKPAIKWSVPKALLTVAARSGDLIGRLRNRRFPLDSDSLDKLLGSAWYSSAKIERELGFRPRHRLQDALPEIVQFLLSK